MQNSSSSSTQAMEDLERWVKANVKIRRYLKEPASFAEMTDGDRRRAELEDRTKAAAKLMNEHFGKTPKFTEIMGRLSDIRGTSGRAVFSSALREVLLKIQDTERTQFVRSRHAGNRKLARV